MGVKIRIKGDSRKLNNFLDRLLSGVELDILNRYGRKGVEALKEATPKDTGKTAESWSYEIEKNEGITRLIFLNTNVVDGWANIAILLQYGHGTRNGGWVEARDYINPALKPVFDKLADEAVKELTKV